LGHPSKFQGLSLTARYSSSGRQPIFAVLNRGHHLYSAGRPSRWASAHILVFHLLFGNAQLLYCGGKRDDISSKWLQSAVEQTPLLAQQQLMNSRGQLVLRSSRRIHNCYCCCCCCYCCRRLAVAARESSVSARQNVSSLSIALYAPDALAGPATTLVCRLVIGSASYAYTAGESFRWMCFFLVFAKENV